MPSGIREAGREPAGRGRPIPEIIAGARLVNIPFSGGSAFRSSFWGCCRSVHTSLPAYAVAVRRADRSEVRARVRLPPALVLVLAWLSLADIPTGISLGAFSVSGASTLLAGALTVAFAPMLILHGRGRSAPRSWDFLIQPGLRRCIVPIALIAFCAVAALGALRAPSPNGVQQTFVYIAFTGAIAVAALYSKPGTAKRFVEAMGALMFVVGVVAVPAYLLGFPLWGPRSFALSATVAVAALVPIRSERLVVRLAPYALTAGIAASLSRTALVIAVLLLAFSILRSRHGMRGTRVVLALGALTAAAVVAFLAIPSLRDRFTEGDNSVRINGVALNTSGRSQIWALVIGDSTAHPWIGRGAGTASTLIGARFPGIGQPHNDFLRLWHDFGLIGLSLFVIGYVVLIVGAVRRALRTEETERGVHWGATLALLAVGAAAVTDNPVIYPFVMLPLGVVVGLSIARRDTALAPPRSSVPPRRAPTARRTPRSDDRTLART